MVLRKLLIIIAVLSLLLLVTGCDWALFDSLFGPPDPCKDDPDSRHCYQNLAVEEGDPSYCAKIKAPEQFKHSNPPKDKCYLRLAESQGDEKYCRMMQGGEGSYTREECAISIATDKHDPIACDILSGAAKKDCLQQAAAGTSTETLNDLQAAIDEKTQQAVNDPKNKALQAELERLRKQKNALYENAPADVQRDYFRQEREKVLGDIDDDEVKSAVVREYIKYRSEHKDATIDELTDQMEAIKLEQEAVKRIDEEANKLVDDLKNNVITYASDKANEAVDNAAGKAWEWTWKKGSDNMKWQMSRLERLKDAYDKGSAQYNALQEKYEKFKKVYDEVNEVYQKVEKFNKMVADGKIDEGRAKVLKGGVFLGKGLEYATSYVPVFGSTASTITKETFGAAIKLATKRAERSTSLDKCFEDPLNCDTDGISAY